MPNGTPVNSVAWSGLHGYLAVGGGDGLLKILKFEDKKNGQGGSNLSTNQTLGQHKHTVDRAMWNDTFTKLTTSDSNGLIVVWMCQQDLWFEEMINNRQRSFVSGMCWSPDGLKICIIYDDGNCIVGSVSGERLWGKDLKHKLHLVSWSPDSKFLIFGTPDGEVKVYDEGGNPLFSIKIQCFTREEVQNIYIPTFPLAAIEWYEGSKMHTDDTPPGLCIAYANGRIQLMKNEKDEIPVVFNTSMNILCLKWNPSGNIFALSGYLQEGNERRGLVQFYDNQGYHLRTLNVGNSEKITSLSWEGSGLRIAIATGAAVYYANIKPNHKWGCMENNIVFAYQKQDRIDYCCIFWDYRLEQKNLKYVKNLWQLKTSQESCVLISREESKDNSDFILELCNTIGTTIERRVISLEPNAVTMTKTHIIVCSTDHVYIWNYSSGKNKVSTDNKRIGREIAFFIEQGPDTSQLYDPKKYDFSRESNDPICAVTANDHMLLLARVSGQVIRYGLPSLGVDATYYFKVQPNAMEINCDSSRVAVIDMSGVLSFFELDQGGTATQIDFQRQEVWQIKWSDCDPKSCAFMEKTKLHVMKDDKVEEPVNTDSYIFDYSDLSVKLVYLDELMKAPDEEFNSEELILVYETKDLRTTKEQLDKINLQQAYEFIKQNPHPKLWKYMAEKSLENLDFDKAERAFIEYNDYKSLQLCKRLRVIDDKNGQKAEILAFYGRYDEAENMYRRMERKDLAIQMRMKIGDWFRVVELVQEGYGNDDVLREAYDKIGDFYSDRFKWANAVGFYKRANNYPRMIEMYYNLEDFDSLKALIEVFPDGNDILLDLAERFQGAGLCDEAVECYSKFGDIKKALDCCVLLNHWSKAVELAEKNNFVQVEGLISMYAGQLQEKKKKLEVVELYRKANRNTEAAVILGDIATDLVKNNANPILVKKLYVMAALEVDLYKKKVIEATLTGQGAATAKVSDFFNQTVDSLITSDINTSTDKILTNPWRGAEAWHFYILAQRQMYSNNYKAALKTALRAAEYELELGTRQVYSLVALAGYYSKHWKECSRAFTKLENMDKLSDEDRDKYQSITAVVFTKNPPKLPQCEQNVCPSKNCDATVTEFDTHCKRCGSNFQPCMVSGRSIMQKDYYTCKACKHKMIEQEILKEQLRFCALCHVPLDPKFGQQ